jgi:ABC-2 type transport system ATP-binding protein
VSSHLLREIEIIADDIVMIGRGTIVAQGSKAELMRAAGTVVRASDMHALRRALDEARIETTVTGDGTLHTDTDPTRVGRVALEAGVPLVELRTPDGGLEEMFLQLTADTQRERKAA